MNNVKKYDLGEINIDLTNATTKYAPPYIHYTHDLPLISFGDAHNTLNLSLIFNYENYKNDVETNKNPFFIAPGYKLNLQKHIVCNQNEIPTAFCGDIGNTVQLISPNYNTYAFDDESKRILRRTLVDDSSIVTPDGSLDIKDDVAYNYTVEYRDFSKEEYNTAGMVVETVDKYGNPVLSYEYDTDRHLTSITFKDSKVINIEYESNRIKAITYAGKIIEFSYSADGSLDCVKHYTGVKYLFTLSKVEFSTLLFDEMHKCNLKVEAIATESNTHLCSKELKMTDSYTVTVSDKIGNNTVNSVSQRAATNLLNTNLTGKYFDAIDNNGATVRTWIENGKKLYSYPLLDSAEQFGGSSSQFLGNVAIYNVLKPTDCYNNALDNTLDNTLDRRISGTQAPGDGILLNYDTTNYQWSRNIGNSDGDGGYYILSGWIKSSEVSYDTIHIKYSLIPIFSHTIDLEPLGEWHYFCILLYAPAGKINVYASMGGSVSTCDFRITPIKTNGQANKTSNVDTTEYVLFKENVEIPFTDVSFYYTRGGADNIIDTDDEDEVATVTASDILRYKLRKKKTGFDNEVYYNDCKNVIAETTALKVLYNGEYKSISNFDVGVKVYSGNNISVTRIYANEDNQVNIVKTCNVTKKIASVNGDVTKSALVSSELYGSDLDLLASNVDGITTEYLRDTQGHLISECVNGLYTRTTSYGTNDEGEPTVTVTDEFNNSTIYTLDNIWGTMKSVRLPNGIVVDNTYDENASVLTGVAFDSSAARESELGYSGGKLTSLTDGALNYSFEYSSTTRDLVGVTKNGASIEQHTYSRNNGNTTVESKYPSADNPIRTETVVLDKYNRLKRIGNILQNTYGANEESTDSLVGEKKTYEYEKNKLEKVVTRTTGASGNVLRQETFAYDNADRLTVRSFYYDSNTNKNVVSNIGYLVNEGDPRADGRISSYSYSVNGSEKAKTVNTVDTYKRITEKQYTVGGKLFTKNVYYDKTRVDKITDSARGETIYTYDNMGRITGINNGALTTYEYDTYGQLIRENNSDLDKTYVYEYNSNGNIVCAKTYAYTLGELGTAQSQKSYIYSETQPDRLIDCDGTSITYNAIGCPTVYDGYTTSWDRGKLSSLTIGSRFNIQYRYTFSYNALGQRIQKEFWHPIPSSGNTAVMKGELTRYIRDYCYDESGRLISEHILSQCYQEDDSVDYLVYLYDGDMIIGVVHTAVPGATNTYYFERNLLGDVIAIYDTSGNRVGAYAYDAWGNCRIVENLQRITTLNPIRYRGYYYDQDTRLYYLNARYYCPEWRRFISPDDTSYLDPETPNGLNLYCYCYNNPVMYVDGDGCTPQWISVSGMIVENVLNITETLLNTVLMPTTMSLSQAKMLARKGGHLYSARELIRGREDDIARTLKLSKGVSKVANVIGGTLFAMDIATIWYTNYTSGSDIWVTSAMVDTLLDTTIFAVGFIPGWGWVASLVLLAAKELIEKNTSWIENLKDILT